MTEPAVGQYLYASCSDQDYGRILAVGQDVNGCPTIDIELLHPNDLVDCEHDEAKGPRAPISGYAPLTTLELPPRTRLILRAVQYEPPVEGPAGTDMIIVCNTPGNLCFRCTKLFSLRDGPSFDTMQMQTREGADAAVAELTAQVGRSMP